MTSRPAAAQRLSDLVRLAYGESPNASPGWGAGDAEVVQEPVDQPYGARDCAFRDPAGNPIRIQELIDG